MDKIYVFLLCEFRKNLYGVTSNLGIDLKEYNVKQYKKKSFGRKDP